MKIQAITGTVYENAGYNNNEIVAALFLRFLDNAYYIPNWNVHNQTVKTNQPNHCYIRAPGMLFLSYNAIFFGQIVYTCMLQIFQHWQHLKLHGTYQYRCSFSHLLVKIMFPMIHAQVSHPWFTLLNR